MICTLSFVLPLSSGVNLPLFFLVFFSERTGSFWYKSSFLSGKLFYILPLFRLALIFTGLKI